VNVLARCDGRSTRLDGCGRLFWNNRRGRCTPRRMRETAGRRLWRDLPAGALGRGADAAVSRHSRRASLPSADAGRGRRRSGVGGRRSGDAALDPGCRWRRSIRCCAGRFRDHGDIQEAAVFSAVFSRVRRIGSHESADCRRLPEAVASGKEPLLIVGRDCRGVRQGANNISPNLKRKNWSVRGVRPLV